MAALVSNLAPQETPPPLGLISTLGKPTFQNVWGEVSWAPNLLKGKPSTGAVCSRERLAETLLGEKTAVAVKLLLEIQTWHWGEKKNYGKGRGKRERDSKQEPKNSFLLAPLPLCGAKYWRFKHH